MYHITEWGDDMRVVEYIDTKKALGGPATLGFASDAGSDAAERLMKQLWLEVYTFEKRFSRFLQTSELSIFNQRAGARVAISAEFEKLLRAARQQAQATQGLYDPFILPALQKAGYKGTADATYAGDATADYSKRTVADISQLEIEEGYGRIPYSSAIDLGGCGKGYLADQLGLILREAGVAGYWLELSGDIAMFGEDADGRPVTVAVQSAAGDTLSEPITCPSSPSGVATSGTFRRSTQSETLTGHHIIDPRTGRPAETDVLLATVQADTAIDADVLASCAVIVGSERAADYLRHHGARAWIIQYQNEDGAYELMTEGINTAIEMGAHA